MMRPHRSAHRVLWPALALAIGLGFMMALFLRLPAPVEAPRAAQESPR